MAQSFDAVLIGAGCNALAAAVTALAASGYHLDKSVKFKIQTTKGVTPKDYPCAGAAQLSA